MKISFDPAKRDLTLRCRSFDFAIDAVVVFDGPVLTVMDDRIDYGEPRFQTYGLLTGRLVMVVWSPADDGRRIISMRKCNDREQVSYRHRLG